MNSSMPTLDLLRIVSSAHHNAFSKKEEISTMALNA
jgi:hypothetical protein